MKTPLYPDHCPLHYVFSHHETAKADIRRFRYLTDPGSYQDATAALRTLCGTITLGTELYPTRAFPIPVNDPLFRRFAAKLLKAIPHLAFYIDLKHEGPWLKYIVWATLKNIEVIDYRGSEESRPTVVKPDPDELNAEAHEIADAAVEHYRLAGVPRQDMQQRCDDIIAYLIATD